jgi:hypothetical protein
MTFGLQCPGFLEHRSTPELGRPAAGLAVYQERIQQTPTADGGAAGRKRDYGFGTGNRQLPRDHLRKNSLNECAVRTQNTEGIAHALLRAMQHAESNVAAEKVRQCLTLHRKS